MRRRFPPTVWVVEVAGLGLDDREGDHVFAVLWGQEFPALQACPGRSRPEDHCPRGGSAQDVGIAIEALRASGLPGTEEIVTAEMVAAAPADVGRPSGDTR